jgi:hypothetical protein
MQPEIPHTLSSKSRERGKQVLDGTSLSPGLGITADYGKIKRLISIGSMKPES